MVKKTYSPTVLKRIFQKDAHTGRQHTHIMTEKLAELQTDL